MGSHSLKDQLVLPSSFGPLGGQIMVADDQQHQLYTIDNASPPNVNYNPFGFPDGTFFGAEQILVIPEFPCTYCGDDHAFFTASAVNDTITSYPKSDFAGLGGDILVTTELNPSFGTFRVHFDVPSNSYQFLPFDPGSISNEGSAFVDGSCPPSPTPTPTATFTPTATATALRLQLQRHLRLQLRLRLRLQLQLHLRRQRIRLLLQRQQRLQLQRPRRLLLLPHPLRLRRVT